MADHETGALSPAAAAYVHARTLSRALHTGQAVLFEGKRQFIQVLIQRESGGEVETTLYLKGRPVEVPAGQVTVVEEIGMEQATIPPIPAKATE